MTDTCNFCKNHYSAKNSKNDYDLKCRRVENQITKRILWIIPISKMIDRTVGFKNTCGLFEENK